MARDNRLRHTPSESPAPSGRFAVLRSVSATRTVAILAFAAAAFIVVAHLAGLGGGRNHSEPAFLTKELGAPQRSGTLVRKPAPNTKVTIRQRGGYTVAHHRRSVTLVPTNTGDSSWRTRAGGATRPTPFGRETVLVTGSKNEQYLTVTQHQGLKTWQWQLGTGTLHPSFPPDRGIAFAIPGSTKVDFHLLPAAILGTLGTNVAPAGLGWSMKK